MNEAPALRVSCAHMCILNTQTIVKSRTRTSLHVTIMAVLTQGCELAAGMTVRRCSRSVLLPLVCRTPPLCLPYVSLFPVNLQALS